MPAHYAIQYRQVCRCHESSRDLVGSRSVCPSSSDPSSDAKHRMIAYQRPFSPKPEEIVHVVSLSIISLSEKPKSLRKLAVADGCCGDDVPILLSCALSTHQKLAARRNSIYGTASTFKTQIKGKDTNIFSITTLLEDRHRNRLLCTQWSIESVSFCTHSCTSILQSIRNHGET